MKRHPPDGRALLAVTLAAFGLWAAPGAAQDAASGPDVLSETYRNWVVTCRTMPPQGETPAARLCEMTQELRQAEGGQRVLALSLRPAETEGAAELTMITPFGLKVTETVGIDLGDTALARLPFHTCLAAGCIVRGELGPETLATLGRGESAQVSLPTTGGGQLRVTVSLLGFEAAWNRLRTL